MVQRNPPATHGKFEFHPPGIAGRNGLAKPLPGKKIAPRIMNMNPNGKSRFRRFHGVACAISTAILAVLSFSLGCASALGNEMPLTAEELVNTAKFVALVEVREVTPLRYEDASSDIWIYPQHATALVERNIFGELRGEILLESYDGGRYHGQSVLSQGAYLAFLVPHEGSYELSSPCSLRRVEAGKVYWFDGYTSLSKAIVEIQNLWTSRN